MMRHITLADLPDVRADAEGLRTIARSHRESVQRTHEAASSISNSWRALDEHVQAPFSDSFDRMISPLARTADRFQAAAQTLSDALEHFAGELDGILRERRSLRADVEFFLKLVRRSYRAEPELAWHMNVHLRDQNVLLTDRCNFLRRWALDAEGDLCRRLDGIASRSEITAGMRTTAEPGYGGSVVLPQWRQREAAFDSALADAARTRLDAITQMTPEQLARWVASHESLIHELVDSADPLMVAAWWEGVSIRPELVSLLVATAPMLMGGLDGVPPAVRVAANVNVAKARLAANNAEIAALDESQREQREQALRAENTYLQRAIDGKVQLYLYDPERDRIIEMFGNPATATRRMNWVPGTTTVLGQFYDSLVTDLPRRIANETRDSLVFVMKDGRFPQLDDLRVSPARTELMQELGSRVARFEAGMDAAGAAHQHTVMVGHSAGLAIAAAAETHGAKVDTMISLSGAGMSSTWAANPATDYYDMTPDLDVIRLVRETAIPAGVFTEGKLGFPLVPESKNGFIEIDPEIGRDLDAPNLANVVLPFVPGNKVFEAAEGVMNHLTIPSKDTSDVVVAALHDALRDRELQGRRRDGE